jgi:hypothetical protein
VVARGFESAREQLNFEEEQYEDEEAEEEEEAEAGAEGRKRGGRRRRQNWIRPAPTVKVATAWGNFASSKQPVLGRKLPVLCHVSSRGKKL